MSGRVMGGHGRVARDDDRRVRRLITVNGITDSISGWCRRSGLEFQTVLQRLKYGWSEEDAVTKPSGFQRLAARAGLVVAMTLGEATRIAGTLGKTSKMPGYSYGLDAFRCIEGSKLAKVKGSTCEGCYARKNFYRTWRPAIIARERRHAGLDHPRWCDAMVLLISRYCEKEPWFRWHDSGDIMSLQHLERIIEVVRRTPKVRHWLPTREYGFVDEYLRNGGAIPDNLAIRLSATMIGQRPDFGKRERLRALPTSTVHRHGERPVRGGPFRRNTIACRAPERDNTCGKCRACWEPRVKNVSYEEH